MSHASSHSSSCDIDTGAACSTTMFYGKSDRRARAKNRHKPAARRGISMERIGCSRLSNGASAACTRRDVSRAIRSLARVSFESPRARARRTGRARARKRLRVEHWSGRSGGARRTLGTARSARARVHQPRTADSLSFLFSLSVAARIAAWSTSRVRRGKAHRLAWPPRRASPPRSSVAGKSTSSSAIRMANSRSKRSFGSSSASSTAFGRWSEPGALCGVVAVDLRSGRRVSGSLCFFLRARVCLSSHRVALVANGFPLRVFVRFLFCSFAGVTSSPRSGVLTWVLPR